MIQVDNLTKRYGPVTAIHDVSFTVEKGRIVGFLGPNGAGKSTTMKILSCFMPASGGTARVAGYDVFSQSLESAGGSAISRRTPLSIPISRSRRIWTSWPRSRAWAGPRGAAGWPT